MSMSDQNDQTQETVVVDGRNVTPDEFKRIQEDVNQDPNKKLTEVSPGVWKTLQRLHD